jgi:hypothetical protein
MTIKSKTSRLDNASKVLKQPEMTLKRHSHIVAAPIPMHNVPVTNKVYNSKNPFIQTDNKARKTASPSQAAHNKQSRSPNGRRPPIGNTHLQLAPPKFKMASSKTTIHSRN